MKKNKTLSIITAIVLMGTTSVMAEMEDDTLMSYGSISPEMNAKIEAQMQENAYKAQIAEAADAEAAALQTEEIRESMEAFANMGEIQPDGVENSNYTKYGTGAGGSSTAFYNAFFGALAGNLNTTGRSNTMIGDIAGVSNTIENNNTFVGANSAYYNTASDNTFIGFRSGYSNTTGSPNTFLGTQSGYSNLTGSYNTLTGYKSGYNLRGNFNTFSGHESGYSAITANSNVFTGFRSGYNTTTGGNNSFYGWGSGYWNSSGQRNVFIGQNSGYKNISGDSNTFLGEGSGFSNVTGSKNVFLGFGAGYNETGSNKLYIENSNSTSPLIYGEFDNKLVRINGSFDVNGSIVNNDTITSSFNSSDTANNHNMLALDSNNAGSGASDVGFSIENKETDFKWTFRTYAATEGFAASKVGTGGIEFAVDNTGTTLATTVVKMGGVTVFESGHLVTASSRSLKTDIQPLDTQAALDAFHKLQPVSYAYKTHKDDAVVGFIAEDVPELVAMPSRKSIDSTEIVAVLTSVVKEQEKVLAETRAEAKAKDEKIAMMEAKQKVQEAKIAKLETMQKKVAMMESILINLALDTSNTVKEKVSVNLK